MAAVCERLERCPFVIVYWEDPGKKNAISGLVATYCKGDMQGSCVRKKVSKVLGDPEKVPKNMMPTGLPISGTSSADWPEDVIIIVKESIGKNHS